MASALFPLLQKFSRDEWVKLDRNKITPWAFFNSGWPFEITDFYGRTIASQGFEFSGSIRDLFWHRYIEPFLEEIVDRGFNETLRLARDRSQLRREPFEEMGGQLISLSGLAFRRMADIDQRLRGKGKPKSVLLYDPDRELSEVSRFIQRRMRAEIEMLPKSGVDMGVDEGSSWHPWEGLSDKLDKIQGALDALVVGPAGIGHNQPPSEQSSDIPGDEIGNALTSIANVRKELLEPEAADPITLEDSANHFLRLWSSIKKLAGKAAEGAVSAVGRLVATGWLKQHPSIETWLIDAVDAIFRWVGRIVG